MRRFCLRIVLLITINLILGIALAAAQNKRDTLHVALNSVEVKASHFGNTIETVPMATSLIERSNADMNRNPALTLNRLTYSIPGLWISNRQNYALGERITMRGMGWRSSFGVRGIQILLDGIPLTMADGQSILNIVDPAFIQKIRVIRGPASAFWGNSSGGVIDLSTMPPKTAAYHVKIGKILGSYGLDKTDLQWNQNIGKSRFNVYTSYLNQKGYRYHSNVRLSRTGFTGTIPLNRKSGLDVIGAYESMPLAQNPGTLTKVQAENNPRNARSYFAMSDARKRSKQGQLGLRYHDYTSLGTLNAVAYGIFRDLTNPLPYAYIKLKRAAGGGRLTMQGENKWFKWNVGYDGKFQHDNRINWDTNSGIPAPGDSLGIDQAELVYNNAFLGGISIPLSNWNFSVGLRYDFLVFKAIDHIHQNQPLANQSGRRLFLALSPTFGISYNLDSLQVYADMSSGFDVPTTTELVNRPSGVGGFNPNLGPEHTRGYELGAKGRTSFLHLSYNIALYYMKIRDLLLPYQASSGRVYYRNAGRTKHMGVDASLKWMLGKNVVMNVAYSYIRAEFLQATSQNQSVSYDGNFIPGIPQNRLNIALTWIPKPLWISLDAESVSSYYVNNENTVQNNAYLVANIRLSTVNIHFKNGIDLIPFVAINNLANTRYNGSVQVNASGGRYFEPAAGRNWEAGLTLQY